jgi:caffeoyl-CoA O-methyltransferase
MPISMAQVATPRPGRYIKQLVAHLGHKAATELSVDGRATIAFRAGDCVLLPAGDQIDVFVAAKDLDGLTAMQDVVARHLLRFAAREELVVGWSAPADGADNPIVDPFVSDYLLAHCTPPDELLRDLAARTDEIAGPAARMRVSHDQGALLSMLVKLAGARNAVEVGLFTGYSSLCIARALPAGGKLLACEINPRWAATAAEYWKKAGVADRIEVKLGPALETLRALPAEPAIDIAFIDADKESYPAYYEQIVPRLNPGGLVVLDNVLQGGRVLDPAHQGEHHVAIRELNDRIAADTRVEAVMLPVRDGITLARRIAPTVAFGAS